MTARCEPRLSRATAWISSTMIVVTVRERRPAALRGDEQVQRLGCRDQEVRRPLDHRRAHRLRGVAGAHLGAERRQRHPHLRRDLGDLAQRRLEVLLHVDRERLQRRDVDDLGRTLDHLAALGRAVQRVDADEEPGERLARTGRGRDQGVVRRPRSAASPRSARESDPPGSGARTRPAPRGETHSCRSSGTHDSSIPDRTDVRVRAVLSGSPSPPPPASRRARRARRAGPRRGRAPARSCSASSASTLQRISRSFWPSTMSTP